MQIRKFCLTLSTIAALVAPAIGHADPVRVMSFNIRYGTAPDGPDAWPLRRTLVTQVISDDQPDVLGVQEALRDQLDVLVEALPHYAKVGAGRNAAGDGEYSAILFRQSRFDLCDAGTFWLSATPETPGSRTWGNNLPRVCTWARLFDRTNNRRFVVFNTHWDHESQPARLQGGELLGRRICELCADDEPAIVTGDFNADPNNPAFKALLAGGRVHDTFAALYPDETQIGTFNGFGKKLGVHKIDAVLISDDWHVEDAAIVRTRDGDRFPSDHFPVTATVTLPDAAAP